MVELLLWALLCFPGLVFLWLLFKSLNSIPSHKKLVCSGSFLWLAIALLLAWGQGIEFLNPWPSFRRPSLTRYLKEISQAQLDSLWTIYQAQWLSDSSYLYLNLAQRAKNSLASTSFQIGHNLKPADTSSLMPLSIQQENFILTECNKSADWVLKRLGEPAGRELRQVKNLGPLSTFLALAYGGPAFHDPLTSEAGLVSYSNYPTTRAWRIIALCHETLHAKGFTREIDTEILTFFVLKYSTAPVLKNLAALVFLDHHTQNFESPHFYDAEKKATKKLRAAVFQGRPVLSTFRKVLTRLSASNRPERYGHYLQKKHNPRHPYFASIYGLETHFFTNLKSP